MYLWHSKHSNPNQTVVFAMVKMLKQLRNQRVVEYDALRNFLRSEIEGADALFIPALDVLFLLDLLEFRHKTDCFEYVGP